MKTLLLNIYFWPAFTIVTLVGLAVLPFIILVNVVFLSRTLGSTLRRAIRFYGWVLVCLVPFLRPVRVVRCCSREWQLLTPAIFVANHNSAIDPYLFGAMKVENSFVTSWPFKIPVYNIFMRLAGYANADHGWEEVLKKGKALLAAGSSLTIWPEGHRSRNGLLGRFKKGAFRLAVETGTPLIPVCILGSATVLPPGSCFLRPGTIRLLVLDPVYPNLDKDRREEVVQLKNQVYEIIERTLRENNHFQFCSGS